MKDTLMITDSVGKMLTSNRCVIYTDVLLNLYARGIQPSHCICCSSVYFIPPCYRQILHSFVMCVAVSFSCPQSHPGDGLSPHLWSMCSVLPWSVRDRFNATHFFLGKSLPGNLTIELLIRLSLLGSLLFQSLFHLVFILNFSDINFSAR